METYLLKWLHETDTNIIELEKDVAPDGWECKWDRYAIAFVINKFQGIKIKKKKIF